MRDQESFSNGKCYYAERNFRTEINTFFSNA